MYNALKSMSNNKCPGLDGLTKEFYLEFFDILGPLLLHVYDHAFEKKLLNCSARMGLISLIPKKSKNLLELKSYRPLSILNLDYKILSKMFAELIEIIKFHAVSIESSNACEILHVNVPKCCFIL